MFYESKGNFISWIVFKDTKTLSRTFPHMDIGTWFVAQTAYFLVLREHQS